MELWERILKGDQRAAARLMRMLDDREDGAFEQLAKLHPHTGRAGIIGVTGSPGVGKSSLIDALITLYRNKGMRVGVVAVDPTSPFSGGAILGDRVRMQRHATDPGVFIRSLATRGMLGGLSASAGLVVQVMDAMGYDRVLLETVGVGQDEVDVVRWADVVVVVLAPGLGDEVQAHKAGILEIADILAVNKADMPQAESTYGQLKMALELAEDKGKNPVLLKVSATRGDGMDDLLESVEHRLETMEREGRLSLLRARREEVLVRDLVESWLGEVLDSVMKDDETARRALQQMHEHRLAPNLAADTVRESLIQTLCRVGHASGQKGQAPQERERQT